MAIKTSISVLLPSLSDGAKLQRQLSAVLPQLEDQDELILLANGSNDETLSVIDRVSDYLVYKVKFDKPLGVCGAYNTCASLATKDWVLGASGNDELRPGALDAFRSAAKVWPEARLMFGDVSGWPKLMWLPCMGFIHANDIPALWYVQSGWRTHGAGAFIRRDTWGCGYHEEMEWMADWFQTFIIGARHGVVYLDKQISKIELGGTSYSAAHADKNRYNAAIGHMRRIVHSEEYADVFVRCMLYDKMTGWLADRR